MRKSPKSFKARQNEGARNRRLGIGRCLLSDEQENISSYRLDLIYIRSAREEKMIYASKKELVKLKAEDKKLYKEEELHLCELGSIADRKEEMDRKEEEKQRIDREYKSDHSDWHSNDAFDW